MEIAKNKNPQASLQIFYRFLYPYPRRLLPGSSLMLHSFVIEDTEMEITKNKNPQASLQIYYNLNPYTRVWVFLWKSQIFGKSLKTFGTQIFFLRFLNPQAGMDFPMDFWLFSSFINVTFKIIPNFKFYKHCFIKGDLRKHTGCEGYCRPFFKMVSCINRLSDHDKIFTVYPLLHLLLSSGVLLPAR